MSLFRPEWRRKVAAKKAALRMVAEILEKRIAHPQLTYFTYVEKFLPEDDPEDVIALEYNLIGSKQIYEACADGEMRSNDQVYYYAICIANEDKLFRTEAADYRVFLPTNLSINRGGLRALLLLHEEPVVLQRTIRYVQAGNLGNFNLNPNGWPSFEFHGRSVFNLNHLF